MGCSSCSPMLLHLLGSHTCFLSASLSALSFLTTLCITTETVLSSSEKTLLAFPHYNLAAKLWQHRLLPSTVPAVKSIDANRVSVLTRTKVILLEQKSNKHMFCLLLIRSDYYQQEKWHCDTSWHCCWPLDMLEKHTRNLVYHTPHLPQLKLKKINHQHLFLKLVAVKVMLRSVFGMLCPCRSARV